MNRDSIHAPGASWEAIRAARARREALKQKPGPKPEGDGMNRYSEAFESWATKAGYATQRDYTGGYVSPLTQCAWRAWQAGGTKMQEEIAALRERNAALEKVQSSLAMLVRRLTYALRNNDGAATLRHQAHDYLTRNNLAGDPLREAGYLGEEG